VIKKIKLGAQPCFAADAQLADLKTINYIFGPNGSGKTTVSQFLRDVDKEQDRNRAEIDWYFEPQTIRVYNRNSFRTSFTRADGAEPGVFLLGEDSGEKFAEIGQCEFEQNKIDEKIKKLRISLESKEEELKRRDQGLAELIWKKKEEIPAILAENMSGLKGSKSGCKNKVLKYARNSQKIEFGFSELEEKALKVFDEEIETQNVIPLPPEIKWDEKSLIEILENPILGVADVPLSSFISRLDISNWVREGIDYFQNEKNEERLCPFCQQQVSSTLTDKLLKLFDENYENNRQKVINFKEKISGTKRLLEEYESENFTSIYKVLDRENVVQSYNVLISSIDSILTSVDKKIIKPSETIHVSSIYANFSVFKNLVYKANQEIALRNSIIKDRKNQQREIVEHAWKVFACYILKDIIDNYNRESEVINKAISGIRESLDDQQRRLDVVSSKLSKLRSQVTSSFRTIEEINKLLQLAQFHSFRLTPSETIVDGYRIIREDGHPADIDTLSEGERTFITFLYFFHSLSAIAQEGETEKTVAVIDDPISSLDGDTMFVISALIRKLVQQVRDESHTRVRQLFMFTHNTRFHNEVCYQHRGESSSEIKFYRIRKCAPDPNEIEDCGFNNPIRTAYQELWDEVALARSQPDKSMPWLPNVLRRILESYFSTLGGQSNLYDIGDNFSSEERILHYALIAWSHSGSHTLIDSDSYAQPYASNRRWLDAFERIFRGNNSPHAGHYDMMMSDANNFLNSGIE
jgi:hypothetical protein